jgi:HEAT repeat protein
LLAGFDAATPYWTDEATFATHFHGSPILRATRAGMARNVAIALGNWGSGEAIAPLTTLLTDPAPTVRGHAAWALGQTLRGGGADGGAIHALLVAAGEDEKDAWAQEELWLARTV